MADGLATAQANSALTTIVGSNAGFVQLHTGAPGAAGTANVSSVTTRPAITWAVAASASVAASNAPAWTSWAGTNGEILTDLSFWSLAAAGTFGFSMALPASVTMHTGDSLTLLTTTISIPAAS